MKVLIVKASSLGDILHVFPVIDYLVQKGAQIDWVVEDAYSELLRAHPCIHRVIGINSKVWRKNPFKRELLQSISRLREEKYDIAFDLQGNIKSGIITAFSRAKIKVGFGFKTVAEWPSLLTTSKRYNPPAGSSIRQDYLSIVQSYFNDTSSFAETSSILLQISEQEKEQLHELLASKGPHILVCAGSAWPNKQVSQEALVRLLRKLSLAKQPHFYFLWGSDQERIEAEKLQRTFSSVATLLPRMRLPVLQNFMAMVHQVIAMDSLPLHLCATTNSPSFSIFGASSMKKYKPIGEQHVAIQGSCPYGKTFEKRCPILRTCATGACIRRFSGEELFEHFKEAPFV
jgi:heptosyltransferase-1